METLADKLERWAELRSELDKLEEEIRSEVLRLKQTISFGGVAAVYSEGRGSYDYAAIAKEMGLDRPDFMSKYEKITTDWRKLCEDLIPSPQLEELKSKFYKSGEPYVNIKWREK